MNFVFLHEREHVQNPRMAGEGLAEYEQRINDRALEALQATRDVRMRALQAEADLQLALSDLERAMGAPLQP